VGRIGTFLNHLSWLGASVIREDESWKGAERQKPIMALMTSAPGDEMQMWKQTREIDVSCGTWATTLSQSLSRQYCPLLEIAPL
jgi:hypothetical protein